MRWPEDAAGWPFAEASRFVGSRPHRWHVQEVGAGPLLLLIHGAGGATQSWRALIPLLARDHRVVAMDLPGQGFTRRGTGGRCGLDPMAEDLLRLIQQEGWEPEAVICQSAGVPIALRMAELGLRPPKGVIGLNAALARFEGVAGWLFPMMAKLLALNPLTAVLFTATVTDRSVRRLLDGTGSRIGPEGVALYRRLASDRAHVDATLDMMAQWNVDGLVDRFPGLDLPVTLIASEGDTAVPWRTSEAAVQRLPRGRLVRVPGYGHLMHEEAPEETDRLIRAALAP